MTEPADLAAALLRDVPHDYNENGDRVMLEAEVLAALTAALDGVDERAGEVLEGVTPGPWSVPGQPDKVCADGYTRNGAAKTIATVAMPAWMDSKEWSANTRFIAWCREGVPALLAQIAALRAERDTVLGMYMRSSEEGFRQKTRTEAAEAKVEKLRGAGSNLVAQLYRMWTDARDHRDMGDLGSAEYAKRDMVASALRDAYRTARAALTTEADNG